MSEPRTLMHIVHVEDFIHPDAGYQVNMLARLQVQQGHTVSIVAGEMERIPDFLTAFFGREDMAQRDERFFTETGARIHRVPLLGFYSGRAIFRPLKLFRTVRNLKPDVVFMHGEDTLTGIEFIALSRWLPYPLVLDCHMLEMASVNRYREQFRSFYRRFITPIILKRSIPLIRVVDSDFVEKCLGIPLARTHYLSLGTDTDYFRADPAAKPRHRAELGLSEDAFVVLYAGKLDEHKGGRFLGEALREALPQVGGRRIEFLIVGNTVGDYGEAVATLLSASGNRIVRAPTQRYRDLLRFYQAADLAIFPRQCSMSFFEAQACQLPVLFEDNEVNRLRVQGQNAFLFVPGSVASFRERLLELAGTAPEVFRRNGEAARQYVLQHYDFVPIAKRYTEVLAQAVTDWQHPAQTACPT